MKRRAWAIAVFFAIVLPIYGEEKGPQAGGNQSQAEGAKNSPLPPRTVECKVKEDGTTIECNWAEAKPEGYFKRLFGPEDAPNIALFFVGLGGIGIALCTLKKIKTQADYMAESGRGWIFEEISFPLDRVPYQPTEAGSPLMTTVVGVRLRNHGPGIAHIKSIRLRFHSVKEVGDRRVSPEPNYSSLRNPPELGRDGLALPPRQKLGLVVKLESGCLSKTDAEAVERGEMGLCTYGRIDYETFGESHYTQFCYVWYQPMGLFVQGVDKAGFRKGGPDAYNSYS